MATADVGLFGPSPWEALQMQQKAEQDRQLALQNQAANFAQLNAAQRGAQGMFTAGGQLGNMLNPQPVLSPAVQQAAQNQQALQGADLQTPEGLRAAAKKMLDMGNQKSAYLLSQKAAELDKDAAAARLAQQKQDEAEQFRRDQMVQTAELKKMQLEQAAEAAKLRSEDARYSADQRAQAAREATAARLQLGQLMAEMKRMGLEAKQGQSDQLKPAEVLKLRQSMGKDRSTVMQTEADVDALDKSISNLTSNDSGLSGITGIQGIVGNIPGGKAAQAQSDLDAVKGKLMGLGRTLQSQQGGKLGNMAVREWEFIQNMVANLNTNAGKEKLTQNLKEAQAYLKGLSGRMRTTYNDEYSPYFDQVGTLNLPDKPTPAPAPPAPTSGAKPPIYATNGKDRIVSTDGGVTWKPVGAK